MTDENGYVPPASGQQPSSVPPATEQQPYTTPPTAGQQPYSTPPMQGAPGNYQAAQTQRTMNVPPQTGPAATDIPHAAVVASKAKGTRKPLTAFVAGLIGAALGLIIGGAIVYNVISDRMEPIPTGTVTMSVEDDGTISGTLSNTSTVTIPDSQTSLPVAVSEKCMGSVVLVIASYDGGEPPYVTGSGRGTEGEALRAYGSGVVLTEDGYILTNYHVIQGGESFAITTSEGESYQAELVGYDQSSDLAVLKADAEDLIPMEIGSSSDLRVGEWCMTIGYPFGADDSVAAGIVSGLSRSTVIPLPGSDDEDAMIYTNLIQTDASINPGNSGGALVNSEGRLIGICTLYLSSTESSANVGFAIPIDYAWRVAEQIMNGETVTHAYLGCSFATVDPTVASDYGLPADSGAYIAEVLPDTAASEAGLKPGDIIVAVDREKITTADELVIAIRSHEPGDMVKITLVRGDEELTVNVTFGSDGGSGARTGEVPDTSEESIEEQL